MNLRDLIEKYPYLESPAALAAADMGERFVLSPMHALMNRELIELAFGDTMRLMMNIPFQHGKSTLATKYNTAWKLLWKPDNQFLIVGADEEFTWEFGSQIKTVIEKWGPNHGIELKADTRAKGRWQIRGKEGGVTAKGCHGTVVGRPADDVLLDDLVAGPEDALSKAKMDMRWEFIKTSIYSRLRRHTKMAVINTRWVANDPCGRLIKMAKSSGEKWVHIKLKAICEEKDVDPETGVDLLGRRPGEPLCPSQVSLEQLLICKKEMGRWWPAAWQQNPQEEEGLVFRVGTWPLYKNCERGWLALDRGSWRTIYRHECTIVVSVDWAASEKKKSDFTSFGAYALTPCRRMLVLECVNKRYRLDESVKELERFCLKWHPDLVVVEANGFQGKMADECRQYRGIPEPRRVEPHGKSKLQRALHAINMGDNQRILLPDEDEPWLEDFEDQLLSFTGLDDDFDDCVDQMSYCAIEAQRIFPSANFLAAPPVLLIAGYNPDL